MDGGDAGSVGFSGWGDVERHGGRGGEVRLQGLFRGFGGEVYLMTGDR